MHRRPLFSLQFAHALRESVLREPYPLARFNKDVLAGITVGIAMMPTVIPASTSLLNRARG